MPTLTDGVLFGLGILVLDFLAWRFMDRKGAQMRLALRALMFGLSTYVLFRSGMNPLRAAPWPAEPLRHRAPAGQECVDACSRAAPRCGEGNVPVAVGTPCNRGNGPCSAEQCGAERRRLFAMDSRRRTAYP